MKKKDLLEFIDAECNLATSTVPERNDAQVYRKYTDANASAAPADLTHGLGIYESNKVKAQSVVEDVLNRLRSEDKLIDPQGNVKISDHTKVGDLKGMKSDKLVGALKDLLAYVGAEGLKKSEKESIINAIKGLQEKNGK